MGQNELCHRHQNTPPNNKQNWTNVKEIHWFYAKLNCVTGNKTIRNPNDRGHNELLRPTKYYGPKLTVS